MIQIQIKSVSNKYENSKNTYVKFNKYKLREKSHLDFA